MQTLKAGAANGAAFPRRDRAEYKNLIQVDRMIGLNLNWDSISHYCYTIELPPNLLILTFGIKYGTVVPLNQIQSVGEDFFSVLTLTKFNEFKFAENHFGK